MKAIDLITGTAPVTVGIPFHGDKRPDGPDRSRFENLVRSVLDRCYAVDNQTPGQNYKVQRREGEKHAFISHLGTMKALNPNSLSHGEPPVKWRERSLRGLIPFSENAQLCCEGRLIDPTLACVGGADCGADRVRQRRCNTRDETAPYAASWLIGMGEMKVTLIDGRSARV